MLASGRRGLGVAQRLKSPPWTWAVTPKQAMPPLLRQAALAPPLHPAAAAAKEEGLGAVPRAVAVAVAEDVATTTRRRQHLLLLAHPALHLLLAHPAECPGRSGILVGIESPKGCARYNHI